MGGYLSGLGGLESEHRPVLLPALPRACCLTCEQDGWAGHMWVSLDVFGWSISPVCPVSDSPLLGGLARDCQARGWWWGSLHPTDGKGEVRSRGETDFSRPLAFPCGSFLIAKAIRGGLLEGDRGPHGGLCPRGPVEAGRFESLGWSKI